LQASAINCSFLCTSSQYPATVRICRGTRPSRRAGARLPFKLSRRFLAL